MKNLDWEKLSFGYMPTDYNVRCYYRDGKWGEIEVCSDEYIKLHMAATWLSRVLRHTVVQTAKYVCSVWKRMLHVCRAPAVAS